MFSKYPYFIAEAGVNHDGEIDKAKELVNVAEEAGCHAIKFQIWITDSVYSKRDTIKPSYQNFGTDQSESEYDTIRGLELSQDEFLELKEYCDSRPIEFLCTPDETESANFLVDRLRVPYIKIASQDVSNIPFLKYLASKNTPLILSTGASSFLEIAAAVKAVNCTVNDVCIMHCVSAYPAPLEQMNLRVIKAYKTYFGCPVGFSDHTVGIAAASAALALGAVVFEKHITLDKQGHGPDHLASATRDEIADYVNEIRSLAIGLGDGIKRVEKCENENRRAFSRFVVAAGKFPAGKRLTEDDLLFKKVQTGLEPKWVNLLIGKRLKRSVEYEEKLGIHDVENTDGFLQE